jgi:hypothetical protein
VRPSVGAAGRGSVEARVLIGRRSRNSEGQELPEVLAVALRHVDDRGVDRHELAC